MKIEVILSLRKIIKAIKEEKPEENTPEKTRVKWETRNQDAVAYIRLHLSDEQALQLAAEDNACNLWRKIKKAYMGAAEDQRINANNDKFLHMKERESVSDYIARARGLATKCISLGISGDITRISILYSTINNYYKDIRKILRERNHLRKYTRY